MRTRNLDMSLTRVVRLKSTQAVEVRIDAFSAFNWFQWLQPATSLINLATFGQITTAGPPYPAVRDRGPVLSDRLRCSDGDNAAKRRGVLLSLRPKNWRSQKVRSGEWKLAFTLSHQLVAASHDLRRVMAIIETEAEVLS